ncbi:MAG: arginase family protein [Candidatus Nitrosotenuis sp.]
MTVRKKICWANAKSLEHSDITIVGIPDEVGSHARRRGASKAPDMIRKVSNQLDVYTHKNTTSLALPISGTLGRRVYDYGNIQKKQIPQVFDKIDRLSKIPVAIGGDHSNTAPIIETLGKRHGPVSLVYFDAHPDLIGSRGRYYGSVVFDSLPYIDVKSSVLVGIRSPEQEEIDRIKSYGIRVITPLDLVERGAKQVTTMLLSTIKKDVYVSFDMDCLDPAHAPGVSVPVPFGLQSQDVIYMIRKIAQKGIVGMDIMEVSPAHDLNDVTSHLASRLVGEVISACKV